MTVEVKIKIKTPEQAYNYADIFVNGKVDKNIERIIATSPRYSELYATHVIKGRFPLGEKTIATDAHYSICYAEFLGKRFKLGESIIDKDDFIRFRYEKRFGRIENKSQRSIIVDDIKEGKMTYRNTDIEKCILEELKDPYVAILYAVNVIKGRWIEAENLISTKIYLINAYVNDLPNIKNDDMRYHIESSLMNLHSAHQEKAQRRG